MPIQIPDTKVTRATVYREAGDARYREAEFLREAFPSAAVYLAGYTVECHLKWALCLREGVTFLHELPDRKLVEALTSGRGHDLEFLSEISRYGRHVERDRIARQAFHLVSIWSPSMRYRGVFADRDDAAQYLAAIRIVRADIRAWAHR